MSFWKEIKYFKSSEFDSPDQVGSGKRMNEQFIRLLDKSREIAGVPFRISSGYRTPAYNKLIGGVQGSTHIKYMAADIRVSSNTNRRKILLALVKAGLDRRIGLGENFIHVDIDPQKPDSFWTYNGTVARFMEDTFKEVFIPDFECEEILTKNHPATDWSHSFYNIDQLHAKGKLGQGVRVAVLDTGIDTSHESFQVALREGRLTSIDARVGQSDPLDRNGHGTHCSSRYISEGSIKGFSPKCELISYKVLNDNGSGNLSNVLRAIYMAIDAKVDIISTSLGWRGRVSSFDAAVAKVKEAGILWLSASGNDGKIEDIDYPALYADTYSVGSHDRNGKRSKFSDWGKDLDFYSSGEDIIGAYVGGRSATLRGTSMACPSFGGLLATIYHDVKKHYGKIDRETLKKIVECQAK